MAFDDRHLLAGKEFLIAFLRMQALSQMEISPG
jgi:hypothetical protein